MSYEGRRNYNGNQQICGVGWRFPVGKLLFFFVFQFAFSFSFFFGFRCDVESENLTTITACQLRPCQSGSGFFSFFFFVCFFSLEGFFFFLFFFLSFSSFSYSDWRNVGPTVAVRGRKNVEIKVRQHQHGRFELMERSKKKRNRVEIEIDGGRQQHKKNETKLSNGLAHVLRPPLTVSSRLMLLLLLMLMLLLFLLLPGRNAFVMQPEKRRRRAASGWRFFRSVGDVARFPLTSPCVLGFNNVSSDFCSLSSSVLFFSSQFPFCFVFFGFFLARPTNRVSPKTVALNRLGSTGFRLDFRFSFGFF